MSDSDLRDIPIILYDSSKEYKEEYISINWRYPNANDWSRVIAVYKREEIPSGLFQKAETIYRLIGIEFVNSHWGIQAAALGSSDFKSKMIEHLNSLGIKAEYLHTFKNPKIMTMYLNIVDQSSYYIYAEDKYVSSIPNYYIDQFIDLSNMYTINPMKDKCLSTSFF